VRRAAPESTGEGTELCGLQNLVETGGVEQAQAPGLQGEEIRRAQLLSCRLGKRAKVALQLARQLAHGFSSGAFLLTFLLSAKKIAFDHGIFHWVNDDGHACSLSCEMAFRR
jgi:hypothetical protein